VAARPTERPSEFGDALVSCSGSLEIVDIPKLGRQLTFDLGRDGDDAEMDGAGGGGHRHDRPVLT
jgi:hypothetical protein